MTNNNIQSPNNSINNTARSLNKNRVVFYKGTIYNNSLPPPIVPTITCTENGLDFSCPENSEYIGAI